VHLAAHELLAKCGGDFGRASDQQYAAGGAVQAMRQIQRAADLFAQHVDQERIGVAHHF